ncbi:hypothetical protein F5X68DRAFT_197291 [Plectosphaerella plurivora]|uniref:Uncharacterized protein n=1 Tax=Plectosphaerella plurivora TaxID=936078 RepID=A0A9P9AFT6_9PEZI|nr:hypothetical protein F5X68DRAFT_197291 [Plectosphaerella plurivora]
MIYMSGRIRYDSFCLFFSLLLHRAGLYIAELAGRFWIVSGRGFYYCIARDGGTSGKEHPIFDDVLYFSGPPGAFVRVTLRGRANPTGEDTSVSYARTR